jgi:hypothetical protein
MERSDNVGVRDAKIELDGLPVVDAPDSEEITIAVSPDDLQAGDMKNPRTAPNSDCLTASARGVDDARVSKREVLWFRYEPPKAVQS